jgi:ABC-2 type transport system permease protein
VAPARWFAVVVASSARRAWSGRAGLVFTVCFYAVVASVITALWRAAAQAGGGTVAGYDARALTWYILASEAATVALNVRLIEVIGDDIGTGTVSAEMLRPAPVLGVRMAGEIGGTLPRLAVCVAGAFVVGPLTVGGPPSWVGAALTLPALGLAVTANLLAQHAFAAAAFWVRDARSTWFLYQKLVFVLGGMLLPLQVLPGWLHTIATWLPFASMAYVPGRLASGHVEVELLAVQVGWTAVLAVAATAAFAAGERRLLEVGA